MPNKAELETLLSEYNIVIQSLRVEVNALRLYINLLEATLRGTHPQEIEERFEHPARLH